MNTSWRIRLTVLAAAVLLSACSSAPPVPDWQINARNAVEKATLADLEGNRRVAEVEWRRAFNETRRTADPARVARVGLVQCAVQQASLSFDDCAGWQALEGEAAWPEQAYARYLAGAPLADDIPNLPAQHQPIARLMLTRSDSPRNPALRSVADPLSRLVAASALLRAGLLDPDGVSLAVDTASQMGWRRPLMAWLNLQAQLAQDQGHDELAGLARRRLELLSAEAARPRAQKAD